MGAGTRAARHRRSPPIGGFGLFALVLLALCGPAAAQDLPEGGRKLTFGIVLGLDSNDNLDLTPVSPGTTNQFTTGLSFGMLTQTEATLFQLDLSVDLQWTDNPNLGQAGFQNSLPDFALVWNHEAPNSEIEVAANYVVSNLDDLRPVDDFDTGTGLRRDTDLSFAYTWGTASPFQIGVEGDYALTDYYDNPSPGLIDSRDTLVGVNLGFDLNEVTNLTLGISQSVYEETQGPFDPEETLGYTADLTIQRPRGPVTGNAFYDDTWEGNRYGFTVGQDVDRTDAALSYAAGATRTAVTEKVVFTGELDYQYDLPNGAISATASRLVDYDSDNQESVTSGLSLTWTRQMTPLGALNLSLSAASQDVLVSDSTTMNAQAQVMWTQDIVQDWALDLGYIYAQRDETGLDTATSNEVFLNLRKDFEFRP